MKSAPPLVSAYFDGDLTDAEQVDLRAWLLESSQNVRSFVLHSFVHSQLVDFIGREPTRVSAILAAEISPPPTPAPTKGKVLKTFGRVLAVAATLASVVALTYFYAMRPDVVASVNGTRNVQWAAGANGRNVGNLLHASDDLAIESGILHVVFARGGQVALQGPARFRIESDKAGRLLEGKLSVLAPEHAVGFTIYSGRVTAVDLGTEFSLARMKDDSCELHVFDGLVEVQLDGRTTGGNNEEKLTIPQGRAIRFDGATGKVTSIEYDKTKRLPNSIWSQ